MRKTIHMKTRQSLSLVLVTACVFIVGCASQSAAYHSDSSNPINSVSNSHPSSTSSQNTTSDVSSNNSTEDESEAVSSDERTHTSSQEGKQSKPSTPSSKPLNSSKPSSSKKPSNSSKPSSSGSKASSSSSAKKAWFDNSNLTGTQADVGKVVGYSADFNEDIVVVSVTETTTTDGRKVLKTKYSDGPATSIVECKYCHEFPCPEDGRKNCPKYDPLKDAAVTCQICGKPMGNGYYGTCDQTANWNDPTKPFISCNHYSNCLKCGKPVGDGHNGTCHITWGKNWGITTCNHYD